MNRENDLGVDLSSCQDDELGIIECLEDYHRILVNTSHRTVSGKRREIALARAQMVQQLIDRLKALEDEDETDMELN